jgi:hypothetical protein
MANAPTTYKKGSQDIRAQQETFALFWALTKWGIIFNVLLMIVLAYFFT